MERPQEPEWVWRNRVEEAGRGRPYVITAPPKTTVACVIIASLRRRELLDTLILPSVLAQGFSEVVVVGDYHSGSGYRHLPFQPLFGNTLDAQFKRDVGTLATKSEWLVYLCDDHRLHPDFCHDLSQFMQTTALGPKDVIVPARFCQRNGEKIGLNMGWPGHGGKEYCGGHGGIFPRALIREVPWTIAPWSPHWDYFHSRIILERGATFHYQSADMFIEDIEPGAEPWL